MTTTAAQTDLARRNDQLAANNDELRRANESLTFAAARYLALHDLAPVPLVTVDPSGAIVDVNEAALALFGVSRARLLDGALQSFLTRESRASLSGLLAKLFVDGSQHGVELTLVRDLEPIEISIDAIVLPDNGPTTAVLACVDVTSRKRAEVARQQLAKRAEDALRLDSLGVLAAGIAHRFNNLMTVVLASTESVLGALADGSPHSEPLIEVFQAARDAGDLAHQMLAYSGHVVVPARPVSLVTLVRELEPSIRASARAIPIFLDLPRQLPYVCGDEPQLRQIILNVVVNAAESLAGRAGAIRIAARAEDAGTSVVIEVHDDGAGMDAETQARIFDPYFSTKFAGRGLGLAVVFGVVRGHGGTVTVSSALGLGSAFCIRLPAMPAVSPVPVTPVAGPRPLAGTVLLVDDDELVLRSLSRTLTRLGLVVVVASSGMKALAMVRAPGRVIDLVMTDLTMPGMDGVALAHAIHELRVELPIILVSGYGTLPVDTPGDFVAALAKPFDLGALQAVLLPFLGAATP